MKKILLVVSEDFVFLSHRLYLAQYAKQQGVEVAVLCRASKYKTIIEDYGFKVFDWPLIRGSMNPINELKSIWFAWKTMKDFNPDLIHAVAIKPIIYGALAAKLSSINNKVYALTGVGFIFSSNRIMARILRPIIRTILKFALTGSATRVIVQNSDDFSLLLEMKIVTSEFLCLIKGAGVDTDIFFPVPVKNALPVVVFPARILWDKGVLEFVMAAKALQSRGLRARFVIVGEPDKQNPMSVPIEKINDWVADGYVEYWGYRRDIDKVLKGASIVCLPSYREGLPKSLLEGASCGLPLVAFDVPGVREVVEDGGNGYLVPLKNIHELSIALERLILDANLRKAMGVRGRKKVLAEFSQENIAQQTFAVWNSICKDI